MLRVTRVSEDSASVTLKVEGEIVSEWVSVLERECLASLEAKTLAILDLAGVTFIDAEGVAMLKRLGFQRVKIVNCSPLVADLLR